MSKAIDLEGLDFLFLEVGRLKSIRDGYEAAELPVPQRVEDTLDSIQGRIRRMIRGEVKARMAELTAQAEALTPNDVKLAKITEEIERLKGQAK